MGTCRGRGSTNAGCFLALRRREVKVVVGREKWRDCGFEACRRRQRVCTSFWGSLETLGTSRKEWRVFTPGGGGLCEAALTLGVDDEDGVGGGGGDGHGEFEVLDGLEDVEDVEDNGLGGGVRGAVAPGTAASFLNLSMRSLYASFNSDKSLNPCSLAFCSSLCLYLASMRSCEPCCRNRTSWTWAQRRWVFRGLQRGWRRRWRIVGRRWVAMVV
jgi:hypothetical protein